MRIILALMLLLMPSIAWCKTESVIITQVLTDDDKGVIARKNGDEYQIEKGAGCPSFKQYAGKSATIRSEGNIFCGLKCELVLEDKGETCRIWNSKQMK
ncbi:MAG TPA: hypothetical protein VFT64_06415 [Rickettsiales bacterium]|nr:hypothetical protein [Rickettsiales bacterium]